MDRKVLILFIVEVMVFQVFTANLNLHPSLKQYLLASLGSTPPPLNTRQPLPAVTITKQTTPNLQSLAALASLLSTNLPALPSKPQPVSTSSLLTALTEPSSNSANGGVDAALLNNLAMALQLLIVSNLLGSPQESTPEPVPTYYESKDPVQAVSVSYAPHPQHKPVQATPVPQKPAQNQYYQYEQQIAPPTYAPQPQTMSMPNANFVGSSGFADNPFMGSVPPISGASPSRSGFTLMSPYEALSPSSPWSDPILSSPYGSVMTSMKDFQSPYAAIMASENKDLFSLSDFY
ncbi:hypothetical protein ABMA28_011093 [Loxostege sticticalis]|uniref:Uncharacterized protein n=1 Tax=Loxostege sticticalis TaxID=481309 RepID=A0ABD0S664_LOXSC